MKTVALWVVSVILLPLAGCAAHDSDARRITTSGPDSRTSSAADRLPVVVIDQPASDGCPCDRPATGEVDRDERLRTLMVAWEWCCGMPGFEPFLDGRLGYRDSYAEVNAILTIRTPGMDGGGPFAVDPIPPPPPFQGRINTPLFDPEEESKALRDYVDPTTYGGAILLTDPNERE